MTDPARPATGRIDQRYYDESTYFDAGTEHLTDLQSRFQRYRVTQVLGIHTPGPGDRVVDFGCGWGTFEWVLSGRVREIVGIDFSQASIDRCRARLAELQLDDVRFERADAGDTGLPEGQFDVVICADLFEHLYPDDSARVAHEAFRLLAPGGRFVVWTPHRGHIIEVLKNRRIVGRPDPTHVDYKSMSRMTGLLREAGFEIERARYVHSHLPGLSVLERLFGRWVPWLRRRVAVLGRKP